MDDWGYNREMHYINVSIQDPIECNTAQTMHCRHLEQLAKHT